MYSDMHRVLGIVCLCVENIMVELKSNCDDIVSKAEFKINSASLVNQ